MSGSNKMAHTAEHAFIGALQKILGQTLNVRKVEHKQDGSNSAFITISQLDMDTVAKAETMVNQLIEEQRKVTVRSYASLDAARAQNPTLRANEERISGEVRVVEIADHDITACAMEHVEDLKECDFFLVTRLSKSRGGREYEVDFVVGKNAKDAAIALSYKMINVCLELGANLNTVEATARKIKSEAELSSKKLKALSRVILEKQIVSFSNDKITVYSGSFSNLSDEAMQEFAGDKISAPRTSTVAVVLSNNTNPSSSDQESQFIVARSEDLVKIDCNRMFREVVGANGRGGGKPNYVSGVVSKEKAHELVIRLADQMANF